MTNSTQSRFSTTFDVSFPNFPSFNFAPRSVRLIQEKGRHDIVEVSYNAFSDFYYNALKTGVPMKITWTNEKSTGEFFGYVYSVTQTTQSSLTRNVIVKGISTGFLLKESTNKIWTNKSASDIVSEIAKKFKLVPKVTPSSVRFSQQSVVGHTYWEKVLELAERIGYVVQIVGTELHFHPMDKMIDQFIKSVPVLSFEEPELNWGATYEGQTLEKFKPTVGDHIEWYGHPSRKTKTVSGIDSVTGKIYTQKSSPKNVGKNLRKNVNEAIFPEFFPTRISENKTMAKEVADALAQLARWSIPAEGSAQGDARIAPYRTVDINGTGSTTDASWVITKATHFITFDGRYTVDFCCVTDGTGGVKPSAFRPEKTSNIGVRNEEFELATGTTSKPTSSKLSTPKPAIKKTESGFAVNPSKWVGVK
jgi:phage protein D